MKIRNIDRLWSLSFVPFQSLVPFLIAPTCLPRSTAFRPGLVQNQAQRWCSLSSIPRTMIHTSGSLGTSDEASFLEFLSLPKEWQDFETKKDKTHRVANHEHLEALLIPAKNKDSLTNPFDTIVEDTSEEQIVALDLTISVPGGERNLAIHLNRDAHEIAQRTFQRLELTMTKKVFPKQKKKTRKQQTKGGPSIGSDNTSNLPAWKVMIGANETMTTVDTETITTVELCKEMSSSEALFEMKLPQQSPETTIRCLVRANPPVILSTQTFESFRSKLFVGIPVVVQTTLLHATKADVSWFLVAPNGTHQLIRSDSHYFIPEPEHIGMILRVVLRPVRESRSQSIYGNTEAYEFEQPIEALPFMPILAPLRDDFIKTKSSGKQTLRMCTYNILADLYVSRKGTSNEDGNETAYPHVRYECVDKLRRMPMIVGELAAYKADILCLQEVDGSIFDTFLRPVFLALGYDGYYSNKVSSQREGCAMFWSRRLFEVEDACSINVQEIFRSTQSTTWKSMEKIHRLLDDHPDLKMVVTEKLGQVLQVATLRLKDPIQGLQPDKLVVANTHLFWHPMADHIRALQLFAVAKKTDEIRQEKDSRPPNPFFLCGDLNSDPLSGASQLLTSRSLGPDQHDCWKYLHRYKWDVEESDVLDFVDGGTTAKERRAESRDEKRSRFEPALPKTAKTTPPHLELPDSFPALQSGYTEAPPFTNYALNFVDTLDYIYASKASETESYGFEPVRSAPMPSLDDVEKYISMPNECMPSDHVSIVCDFEWRRYLQKEEQA